MLRMSYLILCVLPLPLQALCRDCDFPYNRYLHNFLGHYEMKVRELVSEPIDLRDLETDRERAIFYSGCVQSLEEILFCEERY